MVSYLRGVRMKKHKIKFETIRFPLVILLITVFLRGFSNTLLNDAFNNIAFLNKEWIFTLSKIVKHFSGLVIQYLPLIMVIKILGKKQHSERLILMFTVSYFLFLTITMIVGKSGMPEIVYNDLFGLSTNVSSNLLRNGSVLKMPFRLGFVGAAIVGYIANFSFKITRSRTRYGFLPYIDKDILALLTTLVLTLITGIAFSFIWPIVIEVLFTIFNWIASDISNPISTFVYGFFDRLLSILDLSDISRDTFWYSSFGGSWLNGAGENFVGDISIWSQQLKDGIFNSGFGRFITPYYIINLFAIPGFILGAFSIFSNKKERFKYISLIIIMLVFSFFADLSLPVEIFLIVMAPLLYFSHLFIVASLFALLQGLNLFLGFSFEGAITNASLGSGLDFISYFQIVDLRNTVITLTIIGLVVAVTYFFMTRFYYKYLSLGLVNKIEIEQLVDEFLDIVGGIENIDEINSSPFRIDVELNRPQLFNYESLETSSISRVIETKTSYALYYGTASTIMRKEILKRKALREL